VILCVRSEFRLQLGAVQSDLPWVHVSGAQFVRLCCRPSLQEPPRWSPGPQMEAKQNTLAQAGVRRNRLKNNTTRLSPAPDQAICNCWHKRTLAGYPTVSVNPELHPRVKYPSPRTTHSLRDKPCKALIKEHYCLNSNHLTPLSPVWLVGSVMTLVNRQETPPMQLIMRPVLTILLLQVLFPILSHGQSSNALPSFASAVQNPLWVDLSGSWQMTFQDRPVFAQPAYDDHAWQSLTLPGELPAVRSRMAGDRPSARWLLHLRRRMRGNN
jgi:hypothetical protein